MHENTYLHEMVVRKLFIVFAVLAGLFVFQGSLATQMPREKTRMELLIQNDEQQETALTKTIQHRSEFFIFDDLVTSSSHHLVHHSLIISTHHHHSSL